MNLADISRLFAYTEWANHLILEAAETLTPEQLIHDFGTGQHSVLETLHHMMSAEWVWLERWDGGTLRSFGPMEKPFKTEPLVPLADLRTAWTEIESTRSRLVSELSEETLHAMLSYRSLKGDPYTQPLVDQMQHVANHATHHRGQLVGFLRALGVAPPTTDLIHYMRITA